MRERIVLKACVAQPDGLWAPLAPIAAEIADASKPRLEAALNNIPQGICMFGADERLQFANERWFDIYGLEKSAVPLGTTFLDMLRVSVAIDNYRGRSAEELHSQFTSGIYGQRRICFENVVSDGKLIVVEARVLDDGGWVATHEDITEQRKAEDQIRFLANHDPLTLLANRSLFAACLRDALDGAAAAPCALLLIDLDGFKLVNDRLGHVAGDALLMAVADRLRNACREGDVPARIGGDEFAVLLSDSSLRNAATAAERFAGVLSGLYDLDRLGSVELGASVGVACAPDHGTEPDLLMSHADRAMYFAKGAGGGRASSNARSRDASSVVRPA